MSRPGPSRAVAHIRMPDGVAKEAPDLLENDVNYKKRQHLITFGHNQWGFKNWNWSVTKQELDFVDYNNGKFCAGVVAFVSINVTSLGLHREDIGYATTLSPHKGSAIYNARKASVTNALRETLLGFGGKVATLLLEQLEQFKIENDVHSVEKRLSSEPTEVFDESKNIFNRPAGSSRRKDSSDSSTSADNKKSPQRFANNNQHSVKNVSENFHNVQTRTEPPNFPVNRALVKPNTGFIANHNPKVAPTPPLVPPPSAMVSGNVRPNNGPPIPAPHHPSNVGLPEGNAAVAEINDDETRAERLRRQKLKMDEFKLKQMQKSNSSALTSDGTVTFSQDEEECSNIEDDLVEVSKKMRFEMNN